MDLLLTLKDERGQMDDGGDWELVQESLQLKYRVGDTARQILFFSYPSFFYSSCLLL